MNDHAQCDGAVITFRPPAAVLGEARRSIKAMFPGWSAWYNPMRNCWNAYRDGVPPRFGLHAGGRLCWVSASDVPSLIALLEQQVRVDLAMQFPGWWVLRRPGGGWSACSPSPESGKHGGLVRVVHAPVLPGLLGSLRILTRWDGRTA